MEWVMKKRKAFDKRGDMAVAAWAEQQQRELTLRARNLSRSKVTFLFYPAWRAHHATLMLFILNHMYYGSLQTT